MSGRPGTTRAVRSSFDDFHGDFDALARVVAAARTEGSTAALLYTPEYLAECFRYPGASFVLAPTLYRDGAPVAFAAGFPRTVRLRGRTLNLLIIAFLTVAPQYASRGYGILAWSEIVRRGREAGFDGMVNYCVEGEPMSRMIEGSCRRLGLPVIRAITVDHLFKVVWSSSRAAVDAPRLAMQRFLDLTVDVGAGSDLARIWGPSEAAWWQSRAQLVTASFSSGGRAGLVGGVVMDVAARDRPRSLIIDEVLLSELDERESAELVGDLIASAADAGARLIVVPDQGYADMSAFRANGFLPSPTRIHVYLTVWNEPELTSPLSSFYLDVF